MENTLQKLRNAAQTRRLRIVFFALLLAIGLLPIAEYGRPTDETMEMAILYQNCGEYVYRLLGEDNAILDRFLREGEKVIPISESIERDHGEAAYYPLAPFLAALRSSPRAQMLLWHGYTFLIYMLGVIALFGIVRRTSKRWYMPYLAALLLFFTPRMFGESHYNNKDIVLLALTLMTFDAGLRYMRSHRLRDGLLFAAAGAFAANNKLIGFWVFGLIGLFYIGTLLKRREMNFPRFRTGVGVILAFFACYFLITPASWAGPIEFFKYLLEYGTSFDRWTGKMFFGGQMIEGAAEYSKIPWYYLPFVFFVSTPLWIQALILLGLALLLLAVGGRKARAGEKTPLFALALAMWLIPFLYAVASRMILYNSWRHMYFCYGPMLLTAIYALEFLLDRSKGRVRRGIVVAFSLLIAFNALEVAVGHPYQYAYLNPLARKGAAESFEIDYWHVSGLKALERLANSGERDEALPLILSGPNKHVGGAIVLDYPVLREADRKAIQVAADVKEANYLICNRSLMAMVEIDLTQDWRELFSIRAYGNPLMTVYERVSP